MKIKGIFMIKKVLLLLVLAISLSIGANMRAPKRTDVQKNADIEKYIVLYAHGTVRRAEIDFIGEIEAANAEEAIRYFLPELCKDWVLHPDSKTKNYARIEDPISFVSDAISSYSAQKGKLLRNNKNKLCFLVEFVSLENSLAEETIHQSKEVWALGAKTILIKQLKGKYSEWKISVSSKYKATAAKPKLFFGLEEFIRVSVMYEFE